MTGTTIMEGFYKNFNASLVLSPRKVEKRSLSVQEKKAKDKLEEKEKAFTFYSERKDENNTLKKEKLSVVLQSLGLKPVTEAQWKRFQSEPDFNPEGDGVKDVQELSLQDFLYVCDQQTAEANNRAQLTTSFETLDEDRLGVVDKSEFDHLMTYCGDSMSAEEYKTLEKILKENDIIVTHLVKNKKTGVEERVEQIRYNTLIDLLLGMEDDLKTKSIFDRFDDDIFG